MRKKRTENGLSVRAISGTYVVILGIDIDQANCDGLLGFAIHRTDHTEEEAYWMEGIKTFAQTDPGFVAGSTYSTRQHPIQGFSWSDYSAKPGHDYTYRVEALFGTPTDLRSEGRVQVRISTESPEGGDHDVYFNRGVAASQAYARRFGNRRPDDVGDAAFAWLSRGLFEATIGFIESAADSHYQLRVSAYEFHYKPVLLALKAAKQRGVDVKVVFDYRKASPGEKNDAAVRDAGISSICTRRETNKSAISHNKFIIRVKDGVPEAVLTGGTNFSEGGIFGHSNVSHIVEVSAVAAEYLRYWDLLNDDPASADLRPQLTSTVPLPTGLPPVGTTSVFSPRSKSDALEYYAELGMKANDGLFATFAFGMNDIIQGVYQHSTAALRYAVMEKKTRPMKVGPERTVEEGKIDALRRLKENRFAIGSKLTSSKFDRWLSERDSGLNSNVRYIHNKFMLIDPLTSSPIVIAGSANFSEASCTKNDENMLVVRNNNRVADIYLGEFMRLYNHHAFREFLERTDAATLNTSPSHLSTGDWWRGYFGDTARSRQRQFFAG
ncbi:MAG TPA: phospholipase D-like domain-containing protein [Pirellulaceae bacterium]|nr:phospholipase D-like domain-containing protein [Pirellulaceae bacterium]